MEELFSIQALVHYYDKSSVDHAAVKRLLSSAKIDGLQLLLADGSTTTLQNYVLIPRFERPSVADVVASEDEAPATVATVVMLAEARAAADSIASSSLELDVACSALERLLGSLTAKNCAHTATRTSSDFSVDKYTLINRIYCRDLFRRHRLRDNGAMADLSSQSTSPTETPSSILTAVNARLRLCDLATHCLAVVVRQCVANENKCREAIILSTRLLSLALSLGNSSPSSPSASFSSRNSLRTALISGAIHVGKIASENFDIEVSPWIRNANQLMLNHYASSGRTQIIAAVFGGMIPVCTEYRNAASDKSAVNVMMPLSILHSVLEEQLEKTNALKQSIGSLLVSDATTSSDPGGADGDQISTAAQSFLGERVVAAEEDGDEGRIAGGSGYNACENYIKRQGEGSGIKDLLCSLILAAVTHYSTFQLHQPSIYGGLAEELDALSDGCTSNSEGHPGSIDLFDHRTHMRSFGYRPPISGSDSEMESTRSLAYHRKVAVMCIEALGSWLMLEYSSADSCKPDVLLSILETVCMNASSLLVNKSISNFDVRASFVNFGTICGSILSNIHVSDVDEHEFWEESVAEIVHKSRHCVILMKSLLRCAEQSSRLKGVLSCYVSDFLCLPEGNDDEESRRKSSEDYLLYMMSLMSSANALEVLQIFSECLLQNSVLAGEPTKLRLCHYAITLRVLDFLTKLSFGLNPSKSMVQIAIVRLCNRAAENGDVSTLEEITSEGELLSEDFAKLTPSDSLMSTFVKLAPFLQEVVLCMTGQVLNPLWKIVICPGLDRSGIRTSFLKGEQKGLVNVGEFVLEAALALHDTIDNALICCPGQTARFTTLSCPNVADRKNPVVLFLRMFLQNGVAPDLLKTLLAELEASLSSEHPVSVSLLFRLECSTRALRTEPAAGSNHDAISIPTLVKLLDGCLKKFAGIVPIGIVGATAKLKDTAGIFGENWFEELDAHNKRGSECDENLSSLFENQLSPLKLNLTAAARYSKLLRSGKIEDLVKGVLDELSSLVPLKSDTFSSKSLKHISLLAEVVSQCWPMYNNITASMNCLLRDCISSVLDEREPGNTYDVADISNALVRMSSWRLFIDEASTCSNTLSAVCQFAEATTSNPEFDDHALLLALADDASTIISSSKLPSYITQLVRPNAMPAMVSKLLIPCEEAAVAVQLHARAVQSYITACKSCSIWCEGFVSSLNLLASDKSIFSKVIRNSVLNSPTMANAIIGVVDVLGQHNSKLSAVVLEALHASCVQIFQEELSMSSNDSLYRVLELAVRACTSYEDVCLSVPELSHSRKHLLAELVKTLTACLGKLKGSLGAAKLENKETRLVVVIMGLLHICRNGHQHHNKEASKISCLKSKDAPFTKNKGQPKSEPGTSDMRSPKRSTKRAKHENSDRLSLEPKLKPSEKKLRTEKLCTFTTTGNQFVMQHWYFCYTCGLTGSEGVCVVCVAICHAGHDISYSRRSRFFCDCGASGGGEPKPNTMVPPTPSYPTGSTDSDASSERKETGSESSKRRKCICLKRDDSDRSENPSPLGSDVDTGLDTSERSEPPDRIAHAIGDMEMNLLLVASPLIDRCRKSYEQNPNNKSSTAGGFEESISSVETADRALNLSRNLFDCGPLFSQSSKNLCSYNELWTPIQSRTDEHGENIFAIKPTLLSKPVSSAVQPLARLVRVLKAGSLPHPSKQSLVSSQTVSPIAISCYDEHIAVGQEKGTIMFFKTSPIMLIKSSLERSSLPKLGEVSVSFPVRNLIFHPDDDETLLVIGDSSVCVIVVSYQPLVEKVRIDIELGLNLFDGCVLSMEDSHSSPPNTLTGAEWASNSECVVLVKTRAFVKVFNVYKDNVSPTLFIPVIGNYRYFGDQTSSKVRLTVKNETNQKDMRSNTIFDVLPLHGQEWNRTDQGSVALTLLACTVNGDIMLSHRTRSEWDFVPVCNIIPRSSYNGVSVSAICAGFNPGVFWIATTNGSLFKMQLSVRSTSQNDEICVKSLISFNNAFEPSTDTVLQPLKSNQEGLMLFKKGNGLSKAAIFTIESDSSLAKFSFPGGSSGLMRWTLSFLPQTILNRPSRPGFFAFLEDGGMYRIDMVCGDSHIQFVNDPETVETSALIADIRNERNISKQNSRSKKVLVQERYNPVPSSIGFFEKSRLVNDNIILTYGGPEHYGAESDTKLALGGETGECIISSAPHIPFQFTITVDTKAVLVGAQLKFGGSERSKNRVPCIVRVFGREVRWTSRNGYKRWLDIPFTVQESFLSPREVVFELEPQKVQNGQSSGLDGLVAIDNLHLYEIPQSEFSERKAAYDRDATSFNEALKVDKPETKAALEESTCELKSTDLSTVRLFKTFDPRYATALSATDIALKSLKLSLEPAVRLGLSIGAHSLQLIHRSFGEGISALSFLEKSINDLLSGAFKIELNRNSKICAIQNIFNSFSSVIHGSILTSVDNELARGAIPSPRLVEIAMFSLRVISKLWVLARTELEADSDSGSNSSFQYMLSNEMISNIYWSHVKQMSSHQRLYLAPKMATENMVDVLFTLLVDGVACKSDPSRVEFSARALVRLFCNSSKTIRLFSTRRALHILQDPSRLHDSTLDLARCCNISSSKAVLKSPEEMGATEGDGPWAYRCDNCKAVCEKEWWHCMDCEDFDLCAKCARLDRGSLDSPHLVSHILVRGDRDHSLDEMNSIFSPGSTNVVEKCFIDECLSALLCELTKIHTDQGLINEPVYFDVAQMLSNVVGPQTKYMFRVFYMKQLCSSEYFISRVMQSTTNVVSQFDAVKSTCYLNSSICNSKDLNYAFVFLQVFANVRDSLLLPYLFKCGIPKSFALILKKLEPVAADVFRHAISCTTEVRDGQQTNLAKFQKVWHQRYSSISMFLDDEVGKGDANDIISPCTLSNGFICPSVSSFLKLALYIVDFLRFALQSTNGPEIEEVIQLVPRNILCDLVSSEARDPRLKGNPALQTLIHLSRKLLLVVSGKNEASMHRVIDTHVYHVHILDLKKSVNHKDISTASNYSMQVEVASTFKSLHRLVSKRASTWREFCVKNPESLEIVFKALSIVDTGTEGVALQLLAAACSISKDMAVESIRCIPVTEMELQLKRSHSSFPKSKKTGEINREPTDTRQVLQNSIRAEEQAEFDNNPRSCTEVDWINLCSRLCADEPQVSIELFCRNSYSVLHRIIFGLLLQRQSIVIRTAASRILCCVIARAAVSNDEVLINGIYAAILKAMNRMPAAGSLGAELGQAVEVFASFCNEGFFECLGPDRVVKVASLLINSLRARAASLVSHPNAHIYKALANIVDLQGYYLEAEPCATCSTEAFESHAPAVHRLEAIRVEAKFTDSEIMCRLVSVQAVNGVSVKVVDPRRTRRVKKIDVYYSPRIVSDATELKSPTHPWRYFASLALSPNQLEGKVDLTVPISTANLRFSFSEFYSAEESASASGNDCELGKSGTSSTGEETGRPTDGNLRSSGNPENLQCPRCSRSVSSRHGICRNCHENAFQCRQCRNINYENLDGFLCNECGYCKHARFEFSVTSKSSFVAEKVVCEEDRKRAAMVIEKESAEVHRRHEDLKKIRSKVLQALALGPKGAIDPDTAKMDTSSGLSDIPSMRTDIATLEALLGGHLPEVSETIPIAVESTEGILSGSPAALDLSDRNIRDPRRALSQPFSFLGKQPSAGREMVPSLGTAALSRQTSLLAILYAKECKSLFMAMSQNIRVLSATRQELIRYAASSLNRSAHHTVPSETYGVESSYPPKSASSYNIDQHTGIYPCYGCTQSFLSICVDLLYTIVRAGGAAAEKIKSPSLAIEMLRLSTLCEKKEVQTRVRRLIVHIVSGNEHASEIVCREVSRKIEFCIDSFASIDARSVARFELALLEDIALIEDANWEKRFRTVIQILFRASKASLSCASIAETVILPCLRIALHLLSAEEETTNAHQIRHRPITVTAQVDQGTPSDKSSDQNPSGGSDPSGTSSNNRVSVLEMEPAETSVGSAVVEASTPISDGTDSVSLGDHRPAVRVGSDQLSYSGAPSSIGTTFEDHASDDDCQDKASSQNTADIAGIINLLKEDHEAGENAINIERWLDGHENHEQWLAASANRKNNDREKILSDEESVLLRMRHCFLTWRSIASNSQPLGVSNDWNASWAVRLILLAPSSKVRELASSVIQALVSNEEILHLKLIDALVGKALERAVTVGDGSREYFNLLGKLVKPRSNKLYLIAKGFTLRLAHMIYTEARRLFSVENNLNGMHVFSLSYGFVLHELVSILKLLLEQISVMRAAVRVRIFEVENGVIVKYLQQAYLFTRRLLSLRTRLTDDSSKILCDILSSIDYLFFSSTGVKVVDACVSELKLAHGRDDAHTVAVVLEQLCNMLCPVTADPICYLNLNKAPTQDEYIRGTMSKNPYVSTSFSGPLMRDVKNKICQDLDLLAFLEDDFGMELLVAGNVIKLDLPIMDVYEQVWRKSPHAAMSAASPGAQRSYGSRGSSISGISTTSTTHHPLDILHAPRRRDTSSRPMTSEDRSDPPMTVIYRLAGLDGEATEPIIDALGNDSKEDLDLETVYKSTEILGDIGGLDVLLGLLSVVGSWGDDAETAVREPALKLLRACCEVSKNRSILAAAPGTLSTLLDCAASAFEHAHNSVVAVESAESLLIASEKILAVQNLDSEIKQHDESVQTNIAEILSRMQVFLSRLSIVSSSKAEASILHLLPFLMQGIPAAVEAAIEHFSFDWDQVDRNEHHRKVACQFSTVLVAAPRDFRGQAIILQALQENCGIKAVRYLMAQFPMPKAENRDVWHSSLAHGGPPAALQLLTGLAYGCAPTSIRSTEVRSLVQKALAEYDTTIAMLCHLEMTASSNSIGSITEELLEALREDEDIAHQVDMERRNLKAARRAAAEASRQAILRETGLSLTGKGEPKFDTSTLFQKEMFGDVIDEVGPACVVCGDGFQSRPNEALGVYVLNRRIPSDCTLKSILSSFTTPSSSTPILGRTGSRREAEPPIVRSQGGPGSSSGGFCFATVTQFNAIHLSCHRDAARSDRGSRREEWEGATLRNSQTICNNIFPLQPPLMCAKGFSREDNENTNAVSSSHTVAVEYYLARLLSLGRSSLSPLKLVLYDLGRGLVRFSDGGTQVFSEHSMGGGPHSNTCLLPHIVQLSLYLIHSNSSQSPLKISSTEKPQIFTMASDLRKYLKTGTGDISYYLAVALVSLSVNEWSELLPQFLRFSLRQSENISVAMRLISFSDLVNVRLKHKLGSDLRIEQFRSCIGEDESYSCTFADFVADVWERKIKHIESSVEFIDTLNFTTSFDESSESCRSPEFIHQVEKVINEIDKEAV